MGQQHRGWCVIGAVDQARRLSWRSRGHEPILAVSLNVNVGFPASPLAIVNPNDQSSRSIKSINPSDHQNRTVKSNSQSGQPTVPNDQKPASLP
jgi:hypothetical protein